MRPVQARQRHRRAPWVRPSRRRKQPAAQPADATIVESLLDCHKGLVAIFGAESGLAKNLQTRIDAHRKKRDAAKPPWALLQGLQAKAEKIQKKVAEHEAAAQRHRDEAVAARKLAAAADTAAAEANAELDATRKEVAAAAAAAWGRGVAGGAPPNPFAFIIPDQARFVPEYAEIKRQADEFAESAMQAYDAFQAINTQRQPTQPAGQPADPDDDAILDDVAGRSKRARPAPQDALPGIGGAVLAIGDATAAAAAAKAAASGSA